jgi:hypothetical protein
LDLNSQANGGKFFMAIENNQNIRALLFPIGLVAALVVRPLPADSLTASLANPLAKNVVYTPCHVQSMGQQNVDLGGYMYW